MSLPFSEILDLVDENGQVANISDIENSAEYANQFVEGRTDYVLIKVSSKIISFLYLSIK